MSWLMIATPETEWNKHPHPPKNKQTNNINPHFKNKNVGYYPQTSTIGVTSALD